jgi:hypothetical protein
MFLDRIDLVACPLLIPFGFIVVTFEPSKLPIGRTFTIQNLKSKIQNGMKGTNPLLIVPRVPATFLVKSASNSL